MPLFALRQSPIDYGSSTRNVMVRAAEGARVRGGETDSGRMRGPAIVERN
jgi:hypothetical protein